MLRQLIAEKLSGLKKAGLETPIISEVAIPAKVEQTFVDAVVEPMGLRRPAFIYGKAYGETAGQWYKVTYLKPLVGAVPVCVAEARQGEIITRTIQKVQDIPNVPSLPSISRIPYIPSITIPTITIPTVNIRTFRCLRDDCLLGFFTIQQSGTIRCPACGGTNVQELTGSDRFQTAGWWLAYYNARKRLGDWAWGTYIFGIWVGLDLNWARDLIATMVAYLGYWMLGGNGAFVMADALSLQVSYIQSSVQNAFNTLVGDINSKLSTHVDNINSRIADINSISSTLVNNVNSRIAEINTKLKSQIDYVIDALNLRLKDLYDMWGIPTNVAVTPVHIRNVTNTGFEFQSFGNTTIYFIAVGR